MTAILTADIHLNDGDEYRWGLFDWLLRQEADELLILGDLTNAKDRHSAKLVNRFYKYMMKLETKFKVVLLKGNHDYFAAEHPFFEFIGNASDIQFIGIPTVLDLSIGKSTFVPAGVKWDFKLNQFPYVFTHATFDGAKAENGQTLTGVDPGVLDSYEGYCYSGDIHRPQRLRKGKITYVGAPYHVRFGDDFEPRILKLYNNGDEEDLHYPAPRKVTIAISKPEDFWDAVGDGDISEGDHVKVRCYLKRADYTEWKSYKKTVEGFAEEAGVQLFGVDPIPVDLQAADKPTAAQIERMKPGQRIEAYAKQNKASAEHIKMGKEFLQP